MKKILLALALSGCAGQLPPPEYIADVIEALKKPTKTATATPTATIEATPTQIPTSPTATALPTQGAQPTESPTLKKPCVGSLTAPDGAGGFLFKDGDTSKKVVVLLPGKYAVADTVRLTRKNGQTENLAYHGLGNPDKDGDRQHWRGSQPTGKYQGKVEVFTGEFGCVYTFKVAGRVD